jgi:hypothetical protein
MRDTVVNSAVELKKIWNDPQRLRQWTAVLLREVADLDRSGAEARHIDNERRRQLQALARIDPARLAQLVARDRHLAKLAKKRPAGRQRGEHAPGLAQAYETVEYIRHKWREAFGRTYRSASPTAVEIAASLYGFTPQQLEYYRRNRRRGGHGAS